MVSPFDTYIRRERRAYGLTQGELAQLVGLTHRSAIAAIENGRNLPSARVLIALCLVFGRTPRQLFPRIAEEGAMIVAEAAKSLSTTTESDATLRANRKKDLLRQMLSRAVSS